MAEVFGIISGVLGLLPLCRDGLGMIQNVFEAPKTLKLLVGRIELQRDRFDEWRDIWRNDEGEKDIKFEAFAKANPATARRILRQLALFSQVLCDAHALEDQYGIVPTQNIDRDLKDLRRFRLKEGENLTLETQALFLERCKVNLSLMKRCKFAFRGKEAIWGGLIDLLKEYNENLATYGPKVDLEKLVRAEFELLRKLERDELRRRAEASAFEAKHVSSDAERRSRYHELALAAQFSEVVKYERKHEVYKFTMRDFRLDPAYVLPFSPSSSMALLFDYPVRKEHRVVLIEWVDDIHRDQEQETRIKTLMLATPKPGQLLLPTCYGMVHDPAGRRLGLVLAPPAHIRSNLPSILPSGAISQKRMPVSLEELLEKRHPSSPQMLDLGTRFRIAKKLVDAVHMMHCVGWVHKNIRANSILFFPAAAKSSKGALGPASGFPQPLGYSEPLFVGFYHARADHVVHDHHGPEFLSHPPTGGHGLQLSRQPKDINLDYYQHPDKRYNPLIRYSRSHDIYSLGVLLLEIGLWKPLAALVDVGDEDFERTKKDFLGLTSRIDGLCGTIYGDVLRMCLTVRTTERNEVEARELSQFLTNVATSLSRCWA